VSSCVFQALLALRPGRRLRILEALLQVLGVLELGVEVLLQDLLGPLDQRGHELARALA